MSRQSPGSGKRRAAQSHMGVPRAGKLITVALNAMGTRFEILLPGDSVTQLRPAGEEALAEIQRLDALLSIHQPTSEVSHLNAHAQHGPVRVSREVFDLIQSAKAYSDATGGCFDVTIGPLMRCWRGGKPPAKPVLRQAQVAVGSQWLELDSAANTVRFLRPGMSLDFGGFAKGFAVERCVEIMRDTGVTAALINGGASTIFGLGAAPGKRGWTVGLEGAPSASGGSVLDKVTLRNAALSVSAVWGRSFEWGGRTYGHVIDPRTGEPVQTAQMAAVVGASALEAEAWSTALLVLGPTGLDQLPKGMRAWLLDAKGKTFRRAAV